jgi:ribonuclease VapC
MTKMDCPLDRRRLRPPGCPSARTGKAALRELIALAPEPVISPVNFLEAAIRADALGAAESQELDRLIETSGIEIAPVTPQQARLAREAYRRFGNGNHPARLNIGDCFAYALAKARNEPLLFKGDDFPQTDIEAAV